MKANIKEWTKKDLEEALHNSGYLDSADEMAFFRYKGFEKSFGEHVFYVACLDHSEGHYVLGEVNVGITENGISADYAGVPVLETENLNIIETVVRNWLEKANG